MSSQRNVFTCCLLFFAAIYIVMADREGAAGKVIVKALGKSGKILVRLKQKGESDAIVVQMEEITEYDAGGNTVGATGRRKHSFTAFANQNFSLGQVEDTTWKGLDCKSFGVTGFLRGPNATITITIYIFKASGDIDVGENETDAVKIGSVKWSIKIQNWEFCGTAGSNCKKGGKNETGEYLDFGISVKSKGKPTKRKKDGKSPGGGEKKQLEGFDLGENTLMKLSREVTVDSVSLQMADGFPKFEQTGSKNIFTFRFPKFKNSLFYDPTLELGDSSAATVTSSLGTVLLAFIVTLTAFINFV